MFKKRLLLFFFICLCAQVSKAQKEENVWLCGTNTGMDFNTGTPPDSIASPGPYKNYEAQATYCDPKTGELLFYTDGDTVWNKNGTVMANGARLATSFTYPGNITNPVASTSQGALIVPMPDNPGKFYVFSLTNYSYYQLTLIDPTKPDKSGFLYYSVVDMSLNGGLGDVVAGEKGIPVDTVTNFSEHMIGVRGNNCNVWVVLMDPQKRAGSINRFASFEITANGVNKTPVISTPFTTTPTLAAISANPNHLVGRLAVSPNRTKMAITALDGTTQLRLALFDFDANTGLLSNPMFLDTMYVSQKNTRYYGVAFSPDNSKLYASTWTGNQVQSLFQLDISSNNANTIISTKNKVATTYNFSDVKLGPDGKIYYLSSFSSNTLRIGSINLPNLAGSACQKDSLAVILGPSSGGQGFPAGVPVPVVPPTIHTSVDTSVCANAYNLFKAPAGTTDYVWNDTVIADSFVINKTGTYWVVYKGASCQKYVDTFHVQAIELHPQINVNVFDLGTTLPFNSYQWMLNGVVIPNANGAIYTVSQNGDYQVIVSRDGCMDTSDVYKVTNVGINDVHPLADQIHVYPNPATDKIHISTPAHVDVMLTDMQGRVIKQVNNATSVSVNDIAVGLYLLRITDKEGTLIKVDKVMRAVK